MTRHEVREHIAGLAGDYKCYNPMISREESLVLYDMINDANPHWISCEEELPPNEKKKYWVCLGNGSQCECRWTNDIYGFGEIDDRWGWSYLDKPRYSTIVAWRELPDPYTESEVAE